MQLTYSQRVIAFPLRECDVLNKPTHFPISLLPIFKGRYWIKEMGIFFLVIQSKTKWNFTSIKMESRKLMIHSIANAFQSMNIVDLIRIHGIDE